MGSDFGLCLTTRHLGVWLCDKTLRSLRRLVVNLQVSLGSEPKEGSVYNKLNPRDAKYDSELATGGTRPDESFTTCPLQRKQLARMMSRRSLPLSSRVGVTSDMFCLLMCA